MNPTSLDMAALAHGMLGDALEPGVATVAAENRLAAKADWRCACGRTIDATHMCSCSRCAEDMDGVSRDEGPSYGSPCEEPEPDYLEMDGPCEPVRRGWPDA